MARRLVAGALLLALLAVAPAGALDLPYEVWDHFAIPDGGQRVFATAHMPLDMGMIATDSWLYSTSNGGDSYEQRFSGATALATIRDPEYDNDAIYAAGPASAGRYAAGGAWDFDPVTVAGTNHIVVVPGANFPDETAIFGTQSDGVVVTEDAGATTPATLGLSGLPDIPVDAVAADRSGNTVYAATAEGVFKYVDDDDDTWAATTLTSPVVSLSVLATNPNVVYAGGPGGLHRSTDGGATWTTVTSMAGIRSVTADVMNIGTVYAANANGVYRSRNGGATWRNLGLTTDVNAIEVDGHANYLYVATEGWGLYRYRLDNLAPTAAVMTQPTGKWQVTRSVTAAWTASDAQTSVGSYDVTRRSAPYSGALGSATPFRTGVTATSAVLAGTAGSTYCFRARARDTAGNVGAYGAQRCTAVPLNDTQLADSAGTWTRRSGSGYYLGSYTHTTTRGATLTRTGITASSLALVATRCPGCGSVKVLLDGSVVKRFDLASSATRKRAILPIATFGGAAQTRTLKIVVTSSGKPVLIEGLGAGHF